MRDDIAKRAVALMKAITSERRRYKELEEETGIAATSWQNAAKRKQKPTGQMIEALSRRWPAYAFWLATGLTDPLSGHTTPVVWTAGQNTAEPKQAELARRYFDANCLMQDIVYGSAPEYRLPESITSSPEYKAIAAAGQARSGTPAGIDEAIAKWAYERRFQSLEAAFSDVIRPGADVRGLTLLIAELDVERAQAALASAQERLKRLNKGRAK